MDESEEKALNDIELYGCHILHVLEEAAYPGFSYSIGIEKTTGQPEIIVIGLKMELAHSVINDYNKRIKEGEIFLEDTYYSGFIEQFDILFKRVETKHYKEYFGWANWFYKGDNFHAYQLIYPSTSGIWPWDPIASEEFTFYTPKLYA